MCFRRSDETLVWWVLLLLKYICYLYTIADKSVLKSWVKIPELASVFCSHYVSIKEIRLNCPGLYYLHRNNKNKVTNKKGIKEEFFFLKGIMLYPWPTQSCQSIFYLYVYIRCFPSTDYFSIPDSIEYTYVH